MKVLWVSPGFAANDRDENCIPPLQALAKELSKNGVELFIISLDYPYSIHSYDWYGISVFPCGLFQIKYLKWINWLVAIIKGFRIIIKNKIDLVHSFWLGPCYFIGKLLYNQSHICTLMGQDVLINNLYLRMLPKAEIHALIAVSSYQKNKFAHPSGIKPNHIIEWGLSKDDLKPISIHKEIDILGCGSLIPIKNWYLWIDIISIILTTFSDLNIQIIGDGPEKHKIKEYVRLKNLEDKIKLIGSLTRSEVLSRMGQAKVFLHTSHFESYGYVLAEAHAMGCQVISTPVGIAENIGKCGQSINELTDLLQSALSQSTAKATFYPNIKTTAALHIKMYTENIKMSGSF